MYAPELVALFRPALRDSFSTATTYEVVQWTLVREGNRTTLAIYGSTENRKIVSTDMKTFGLCLINVK